MAAVWGSGGLVWGAATGNWGASIYNETLSETASAAAAFSGSTGIPAALSESATAADSLVGGANYSSPIASRADAWGETSAIWSANQGTWGEQGATSAIAATQQFVSPLAESAGAVDSLVSVAAFVSSLSEAGAADSVVSASMTMLAELAEAASAADVVAGFAGFVAALIDSVRTWGRAPAIWSGSQGYWGDPGALDAVSTTQQFACPIAEPVTAADALLVVAAFQPSLSESVSAADVLGIMLAISVPMAEAVAAADALAQTVQFVAPVAEALAAADALSARGDFVSVLLEAGQATSEFFIAIPHGVTDIVFTPSDPLGADVSCYPDLEGTGSMVSGKTALAQALARRLTTARGSLFYDTNYGTDLRFYLSEGMTNESQARISAAVEAECLKDERVASCSAQVTFSLQAQTLKIAISVETKAGPFALTLSVSALTLSMLAVT